MFSTLVIGLSIFASTAMLLTAANVPVPVILNYSHTAYAGDVVFFQGAFFGDTPAVACSYNDDNWSGMVNLTSAQESVEVLIPQSSRAIDLLTCKVSADGNTWSQPVSLNKAEIFFLDSDQIAPGNTLRIFGRSLFVGPKPTVQLVAQGTTLSAAIDEATSSDTVLSVTAPPGIVTGVQYDVVVSNGLLGNGVTGATTTMASAIKGRSTGVDFWQLGVPWAADLDFYLNVYDTSNDPRLSLHTMGDGNPGDIKAIWSAMWTAYLAGGGVVKLPPGQFSLDFADGCGLGALDRVVLAGAGIDQTEIDYGLEPPPANGGGGFAVCFGNESGAVDLKLVNKDTTGWWPGSGGTDGTNKVFLKRVEWDLGKSPWIAFANVTHFALEDSIIKQDLDSHYNLGPLQATNCSWCEIRGNTINFTINGMDFDYSTHVIFENNEVARDTTASPDPTTVTHHIAANFVQNFAVLNNRFESVGVSSPTNNDGEVIATEAGGEGRRDEFEGAISSGSSTTLTDLAQNFNNGSSHNIIPNLRPNLSYIAIVNGEGSGQVRTVTGISTDGTTVTIDRPWDIIPVPGQHYATSDWSAARWLITGNQMINNYKGIEIFSCSASDLVIKDNTLTDSDGIMISPEQWAEWLHNVILNVDIEGNVLDDRQGLRPSYIALYPREDYQTTSWGTNVFGATIRGNAVTAYSPNVIQTNMSWDDYKVKASEGYYADFYWQSGTGIPADMPLPLVGVTFQYNIASNSNAAYVVNSGAAGTVIYGGTNINTGKALLDQPLPGAKQASIATYVGGLPSGLPPIPVQSPTHGPSPVPPSSPNKPPNSPWRPISAHLTASPRR